MTVVLKYFFSALAVAAVIAASALLPPWLSGYMDKNRLGVVFYIDIDRAENTYTELTSDEKIFFFARAMSNNSFTKIKTGYSDGSNTDSAAISGDILEHCSNEIKQLVDMGVMPEFEFAAVYYTAELCTAINSNDPNKKISVLELDITENEPPDDWEHWRLTIDASTGKIIAFSVSCARWGLRWIPSEDIVKNWLTYLGIDDADIIDAEKRESVDDPNYTTMTGIYKDKIVETDGILTNGSVTYNSYVIEKNGETFIVSVGYESDTAEFFLLINGKLIF